MPAPKKEIEKEEEKEKEVKEKKVIPEESKCLSSPQNVHLYNIFPFNNGFAAICNRCLKVVKINP